MKYSTCFFQQNSALSPTLHIDTFRTMLTSNSVYALNIVNRSVFELQALLTVTRKPNIKTIPAELINLQIQFLLKTDLHNVRSGIKRGTCFDENLSPVAVC